MRTKVGRYLTFEYGRREDIDPTKSWRETGESFGTRHSTRRCQRVRDSRHAAPKNPKAMPNAEAEGWFIIS